MVTALRTSLRAGLIAGVAVVAGALATAAPAVAQKPVDGMPTLSDHRVLMPKNAPHAATGANTSKALRYGGGIDGIGVTTGNPKVYVVFYGTQWGTQGTDGNGYATFTGDPRGMAPRLQAMYKGLGTNGEQWSGVMTQYCDGVALHATSCPSGTVPHVPYPIGGTALAGVWYDNSAPSPGTASAFQLGTEAVNAAAHFGNTTAASNRNAQYIVVSPTGTHPDGFGPTGSFCAWHDYNGDPYVGVSSPYGDIAFTNAPYVTDLGTSCGQNYVNAGSAGTLDGVTIVMGHEYSETITDQNPAGGWTDRQGAENADKCAWKGVGGTGGAVNVAFSTGSFAMQGTWSNDSNNCRNSHPTVS
jgi:serine protease